MKIRNVFELNKVFEIKFTSFTNSLIVFVDLALLNVNSTIRLIDPWDIFLVTFAINLFPYNFKMLVLIV
jgi:hypothetical protein